MEKVVISFDVIGTPAPKGSPKVVMRGKGGVPLAHPRVMADGPKTVSWAAEVAAKAHEAMHRKPMFIGVPLFVNVTFRLTRPAGHYGKRGLKPSAYRYPQIKPDIDKLVRTTLDAMEGIVFDGDSRIVSLAVHKLYADEEHPPGAIIVVQEKS